MSTIGTIVDILVHVPDAVGPVAALVRHIQDARPEDRAVIMAAVRRAAGSSYAAFAEADERLLERFPPVPPATPGSEP